MTFDELLEQVLSLLQRQRRVAYRALKVRFSLDEEVRRRHGMALRLRARLAWDGSTSRSAPDQWLGQRRVAPAEAGRAPQDGVWEEPPRSPQPPSNALADVGVHAPAGRDLPLAALWR